MTQGDELNDGLTDRVGVTVRQRGGGPVRHREHLRQLVQFLAQQQFEGGVRGVVRVSLQLLLLHPVGDGRSHRTVGQVEAELLALDLDVRPARHVGDQHPHVVADPGRVDVLVEVGVDLDRRRVQPGLVGEG
ncbi:hypothetical protein SDC9_155193 [bioreactor metagenome]|uniref:Uncharacterized protein n=1 Tax=bioreactor metagenome TaxID=1076179 RepID=A0A645F0W6_9ZZZZ